jgi:hypothetical protein
MTEQETVAQFNHLTAALVAAEKAAHDLGLHETGLAINAALNKSGWEFARAHGATAAVLAFG